MQWPLLLTAVWHAELCTEAQGLGLSGEVVAARKTLNYRRSLALKNLQRASTSGTVQAFQTSMSAGDFVGLQPDILQQCRSDWEAAGVHIAQRLEAAVASGSMDEIADLRYRHITYKSSPTTCLSQTDIDEDFCVNSCNWLLQEEHLFGISEGNRAEVFQKSLPEDIYIYMDIYRVCIHRYI